MPWLFLLATLIPLPQPDANEARILLLRADLFNLEGPGLTRFDQAAIVLAHTGKESPSFQAPQLGACSAGDAPADEVEGYLAGAAPLLAKQIPGKGIRLSEIPKIASAELVRSVLPVSGSAGLYASTIGGRRQGVAADLPLFFTRSPVALRINGAESRLDPPREFRWPQRDEAGRHSIRLPLQLVWEAAPDGEMLMILATARRDRSTKWIVCRGLAARGRFSISPSLLRNWPAGEEATLLLVWAPRNHWQRIPVPGMDHAWAAAAHIQGKLLTLLR
ncbi:hypothetical protein WDZ92_01560 [Nostoc sp. NIES-2111]